MATNSENLQRYKELLAQHNPKDFIHIPANASIADHVRILCGPPDLTDKDIPQVATPKPGTPKSKKNPYEQAREQIISKMTKGDQNAIKKQESSGNTDTNFYQDFVKKIAKLGDQLSNL